VRHARRLARALEVDHMIVTVVVGVVSEVVCRLVRHVMTNDETFMLRNVKREA